MHLRRIVATLILLGVLVGTWCLTGCNTWRGVGKDIQKTGEAIEGD